MVDGSTTAAPPHRFFTRDYLEHAVLDDGTRVALRLLTPEDKPLLAAGFERLSPASRYARFLVPKQRLTEAELAYLTEIDQENHFALGAVRDDDGDGPPVGLGLARFIRLPDRRSAEAAIAVADEVQGRGLGRLLFKRLCAAAAERGVEQFRCDVLASNTSVRALIAQIAAERTSEDEAGVVTVDMRVPDVPPTEPGAAPAPHSAIYRLFRAAAENALDWTDAVRRLWRG